MKPYYQDSAVTIYHGDCRDVIPSISCDLVITSPPYNLGSNHHTRNKKTGAYFDDMPESEYQDFQETVLRMCLYSCHGDCFYNHKLRIKHGYLIKPDEWICLSGWLQKQEIVWVQRGPNFDKCRFYPFTERIYWLSKSGSTTYFENRVNLADVWRLEPVGSDAEHSRSFPIEIPSRLLACCEPHRTLDPFMGSGTTLRAAKDLGLTAIGIEIEEKYCEVAARRMEQEVLQLETCPQSEEAATLTLF